MGLYKSVLNPFTGTLQLVPSNTALGFQPSVPDAASLPPTGNTLNDARITADTGHLWVWNGSTWLDQGDFVDVTWDSLTGAPTSSPTDIDDAVAKRHVQNSDTKLDEGNPNEVTSADLRSHLDSTSNPHNVTKTQVGLGNVTNDAQLKAADLDISGTLAANSDTKVPSQKAVKTYVDTGLALKENLSNKSNDTTLASDSSTLYPTQHAVKAYADTKVSASDVEDSGVSISTDGTFSGNSDTKVPTEKATKTYVDTGLALKQNVIGYTPENTANKSIDGTFSANSDTLYPSQKAAKTYVDTGLATKQNVIGYTTENVANKSNDTTLSADSATLYPTQHAAKTYVDNSLSTGLALKEDTANKSNDTALTADSSTLFPTQHAVKSYVDAGLATKQNTIGYTTENVANKDTDVALTANSDTRYPSQKAIKTYVDNADANKISKVSVGNDAYSKLLLHLNNSSVDSSPVVHSMTNSGVTFANATPIFAGSFYGVFGGSNYLTTPISSDFEPAGDFTIDFWYQTSNPGAVQRLMSYGLGGGAGKGYEIFTNGSLFIFACGGNCFSGTQVTPSFTAVANTWYHVAFVRSGNTGTFYINGTSIGSGSVVGSVLPGDNALYVGISAASGSPSTGLSGKMAEFRYSKDIARWTSNFTAPTSPYGYPSANNIPIFSTNSDLTDSGKTFSIDDTLASNSDAKVPTEKAVKTYADTKQPALGFTPENVANKSTDGTLAANSNTLYPSQAAVKTYVDTGLALKENVSNKSNDTTLSADSSTLYPTQHAVKSYADTKEPALGFTPENVANKDTDDTLAANSDTKYPSQKATKTYADTKVPQTRTVNGYPLSSDVSLDKSDVGLGNLTNDAQLKASDLDTDGTLSANSDTKIASQKAVKTYVDNIVSSANALVYKGTTDCSTNPDYPAADAGDLYVVSVAGKIGGASGVDVEAGDLFLCNTDSTASGDQATVGIYWNVIEKNDTGVVSGPASSTDANLATFDGVTGKTIQDSGISTSDINTTISQSHVQNSDTKLDEGNPNEVTAVDLRSHLDSTSNPHSVTKTQVGLGNVTNDAQLKAADLDTDGTLAANSDTKVPSQKAVKTYSDTKVPQTRTVNGHVLSADVTVTKSDVGLSNVTDDAQLKAADLDTDDTLSANSDTKIASQKAVKTYVDTGLSTKEDSLGFTPEDVANKDTDTTLATNSDTLYPSQKAVKTYIDNGLSTKENSSNKSNDIVLTADSATLYPSQHAVKSYVDTGLSSKEDSLGFTPEDVANKDTDGTLAANSDTLYPSQKAVKTYADTKEPALGFTPEDVSNKSNDDTLASDSSTLYPTQHAVKSYVDTGLSTKQDSLGFTPEDVSNKDTDITLAANSDTKYPSQKAIKTYVDTTDALQANKILSPVTDNLIKQTATGDIADAGVAVSTDGTLASNSDSKLPTEKAVKTYADTKQSALGFTPENVANKSTDGTLAANSTTLYPSQSAVKTYTDTKATKIASPVTDNLVKQTAGGDIADSGISTANVSDAVTKKHTQNTDTGTTSTTFQIDSGNSGPKAKNSSGRLQIRNAADSAFASLDALNIGDGTNNTNISNLLIQGINIPGGFPGTPLSTGDLGYVIVPNNCVITEADMIVDQTGSIVVDIYKCTYAQFDAGVTHPVVGDKITASAPPTISSGVKSQDTTLTGWTLTLNAGDILRFVVTSVTTVNTVNLFLKLRKN